MAVAENRLAEWARPPFGKAGRRSTTGTDRVLETMESLGVGSGPPRRMHRSWCGSHHFFGADHRWDTDDPENDPAVYSHTRLVLEGLAIFGD